VFKDYRRSIARADDSILNRKKTFIATCGREGGGKENVPQMPTNPRAVDREQKGEKRGRCHNGGRDGEECLNRMGGFRFCQ